MRSTITLFVIIITLFLHGCGQSSIQEVYVSLQGSDDWQGDQSNPVATLERAIEIAKRDKSRKIVLDEGIHRLGKTLLFDLDNTVIEGAGQAVISGGAVVKGFEKVTGNLYVADVSHLLEGDYDNLRQLFKNEERLPRAQTPNGDDYFLTNGQIEKYKDSVKAWNFPENSRLQQTNPEIHTTFTFNKGDLKASWNEPYVEVLMHHSWESSWQTIRAIDTIKNEAYMNNPSVWPVNFFGAHGDKLRYKLFNHRDFIDQPGEWMVQPMEGKLYYLAEEGEDVSKMTFTIPKVTKLMEVKGSSKLTFKNLTFSHSDYEMGIYKPGVHYWEDTVYSPSWREKANAIYSDWPKEFYPGYSEPQAAVHAGEAIEILSSDSITFDNCTFSNLGSNAIWVKEKATYVAVLNSLFDDLGAGAVKIGTAKNDIEYWNLKEDSMAHHNTVRNSVIKNGGKVFPGCVGIWIGQSYDNRIEGNEIFNLPYSGISLGWTWGAAPNYTKRNLILNNEIHDVLQVLTDGGGIYTLGNLEGSVLEGNEIYNIFRSKNAAGSNSNGVFFDEGTEALTVRNNYIHDILNAPIRFNGTYHEKLKSIKDNYFDVPYIPVKRNNNYNMDFDESGFMHLIIEDNYYDIKDKSVWQSANSNN